MIMHMRFVVLSYGWIPTYLNLGIILMPLDDRAIQKICVKRHS